MAQFDEALFRAYALIEHEVEMSVIVGSLGEARRLNARPRALRWVSRPIRVESAAHIDRARELRGRARELCQAVRPILLESAILRARSRELALVFRRIRGGSDLDSPFIVEIIAKGPMCLECLTKKTGIAPERITDVLRRVQTFIGIGTETARCEACLQVNTTYRLNGHKTEAPLPSSSSRRGPSAPTRNEAVWLFLEAHRGQMFCTQCIATALFATKRIDRAVLGAEGRGALRRHGQCWTCGKDRLLCGLVR
jgi:hypothetical protein